MKSLFLGLPFLLASFIGTPDAEQQQVEQQQVVCNTWYTIDDGCGGTFYLCGDNYDDGSLELFDDMAYFIDLRCN